MLNSQMLAAAGVSPGWLAVAAAGVAVVAYFLGCFNGAVVVSRYVLRDDIRDHGSGNAGLTNFFRTFGGPLTFVVILSDAVKAVLAVLFAMFIAGNISPELVTLSKYWAGAFCMIGHMFPCTFQFRGGKGVLSGSAVAIMIGIGGDGMFPSWIVPLTVWLGFIVLVAATRYVSLGSCWGGASFIAASWIVYQDPLILLLAAVMGGLLLWGHRGNMVRLVQGNERKFSFHKKESAPAAEKPAAKVDEPAGSTDAKAPAAGSTDAKAPAAGVKPEEKPAQAEADPVAEPVKPSGPEAPAPEAGTVEEAFKPKPRRRRRKKK